MTQNQISFAKVREEQRHNLATEGLSRIELSETSRHNKAQEGVSWYSAQEGARHNLATEDLNWYVGIGQRGNYDTQAMANRARAAYDYGMLEVNRRGQDLKEDQFRQQVWKDIKDVERDIRSLDISEMNAETAKQSMLNAAEDMLWRYNLDVDKYVRSGYYKDMAAALRDLTQGGKNVNDIIESITKSIGDFIIANTISK